MVLWPGSCQVHEIFSEKKLVQLKTRHPHAIVVAHPECEQPVLNLADHIGSTRSILNYVIDADHKEFIVATEPGIIHQMEKATVGQGKTFIPAPPDSNCACNECPHMRLNTIEKLYLCLKHEQPEIKMEESLRKRALLPIERMLEMSAAIK